MLNELKPCPFCGEKAYVGEMEKEVGMARWSVSCINSNCVAYKLRNPFLPQYLSRQSAIDAWNRRAEKALQEKEK